jgi:hypothetical protein
MDIVAMLLAAAPADSKRALLQPVQLSERSCMLRGHSSLGQASSGKPTLAWLVIAIA